MMMTALFRPLRAIPRRLGCGCVLLIAALVGCEPASESTYEWLDLSVPADPEPRGAVVFIVDGIHPEIFQAMLAAGELPNIDTYFIQRGLHVSHVVVNTPSVTIPNLTSIATGLVPGEHGVVGVNWFDRNRLIWRNYATIAQKNTLDGDYQAPTIYEPFADRSTYSIFFQPHRGATKFFENWTSNGPAFFFGMFEQVDRTSLSRLGEVVQLARARGRWPAVTMVYLLAPDFRAYQQGLTSEDYRQAMIHTDEQLGRVMRDFEAAGLIDDLLFIFTSDHGMVAVEHHFDLAEFLADECGLELATAELWEEHSFERRLETYQQSNAVLNCSGNRYAALQLRKPEMHDDGMREVFAPWPERPTATDLRAYPTTNDERINLPEILVGQEAIAAVAWRSDDHSVSVCTDGGLVTFSQPAGAGGVIQYRLVAGDDPLGWAGHVDADLLVGEFASPARWLAETAGLDFADAPMQLLAYFRARRAGDIVLFAADGWDFRGTHHAGHGGVDAAELHVPLLIAGPGIPAGRALEIAIRRDALVPTILDYLNLPDALDTDAPSVYDLLPSADGAGSPDE